MPSDFSFLFYDLETTGLEPELNQVLQFACIRTDKDLVELSREQFYVQLSPDRVIDPKAQETHNITEDMLQSGLKEYAAVKRIHELMNTPGTCSIGYNSLAFDDNFLRFSFFRNLLDPYSHQYANNCRRADLFLMVLPFFNFKKDALTWPQPLSLKLEQLVKAQGVEIGAAHDAMNDVVATLNIARLLKSHESQWNYIMSLFDKAADSAYSFGSPGVWLSPKIGYEKNFQAPVISLGEHRIYRHKLLWRLDDPAWSQVLDDGDLSKLNVYRKKPVENGFLWPYRSKYLLNENKSYFAGCLDWFNLNTEKITDFIQPFLEKKYDWVDGLDIDASLYQIGFKNYKERQLAQDFTDCTFDEKITMLGMIPKPYQEQAVRVIWRENPALLPKTFKHYIDSYLSNMTQSFDKLK